MNIDSLERLYVHELKDLFSAENQIMEALPRMIETARNDALRAALHDHLGETKTHVTRLRKIFDGLDFEPGGHRCKGMAGLLEEGRDVLGDVDDEHIVDAAIIASFQRVEHYEMAGYGSARAFARRLGRDGDVTLLTATIEEEGAADRTLSALAEHHVNFIAATN